MVTTDRGSRRKADAADAGRKIAKFGWIGRQTWALAAPLVDTAVLDR
jgi:hypothetical protein